jgi:uncharacterized phage protein gp47/JayE
MAIFPSTKNPLTTLRAFREELTRRTNITNFDRDSKVRALSDVFVDEQLSHREETVNAFFANQLANAQGEQLDVLGNSRGLPRREAMFAEASSTEVSVAFYVESGTFGTINGGSPIVIPSGTRIFSDPLNNELGATIDYETVGEHILLPVDSVSYVSVRARAIGATSNIGRHTLRSHDFLNYIDAAAATLLAINFYPILNGRQRETDDLYRFRISQNYNRLITNNNARIKLSGIEVPGVLDVRSETGFFGIGTVGVVVLGAEFQANQRLVDGVQQRLDSVHGPGLAMLAIPATEVQFDFVLEVRPTKALSNGEQARVRAEINRAFLSYFRVLGIGDIVSLEDLARSIHQGTNGLVNIGQIGGRKLFKKVFVRRGLTNSVTDEKEKLISTTHLLDPIEFAGLGDLEILFV